MPLLLMTALDDPIVPPRCVPYQEVEESSHVILMTTKWGGHVSCKKQPVKHSLIFNRDARLEFKELVYG